MIQICFIITDTVDLNGTVLAYSQVIVELCILYLSMHPANTHQALKYWIHTVLLKVFTVDYCKELYCTGLGSLF